MFLENLLKMGVAAPVAFYYGYKTANPWVRVGMYVLGAASAGNGAIGLYKEIEQIKQKMALPGPAAGMGRVIDVQPVDIRQTVRR